MVKVLKKPTSNDEVSLSQHPCCQCKTLWPWIKWMLVYFDSNIHIHVIAMFCKSSVSGSCACALHIINNSLQHDKFPDKLKYAAVQPLVKKANLLLEDKNYSPVSKSYLGKLNERATGNIEQKQSAYRVGHNM